MSLVGHQVPFAQVQLHPEVMSTPYARCIERDRSLILNALALSIELGVLISITTQAALEGRPTLQDTIVYVATSVHGKSSIVYTTRCWVRFFFQIVLSLILTNFQAFAPSSTFMYKSNPHDYFHVSASTHYVFPSTHLIESTKLIYLFILCIRPRLFNL